MPGRKYDTCQRCGAAKQLARGQLCIPCRDAGRLAAIKKPPVVAPCTECGATVTLELKAATAYRMKGRAFCSAPCTDLWVSRQSSERMARTNRQHASERMKANNPMQRPEVKAVVATKLRLRGWPESVERGGNGQVTVPQQLLAAALGWPMEYAVTTGPGRAGGLPNSFKLDIAEPSLRIAIEVDGNSHKATPRKAEDARKTAFLESIGWTVLRFWNREVTDDLAGCVRTVMSTISKLRDSTTTSPTES